VFITNNGEINLPQELEAVAVCDLLERHVIG
jgi:hypothetical protein